METIKIYKSRKIAIKKRKCENSIFWEYFIIELKTKKVLENYYLNH